MNGELNHYEKTSTDERDTRTMNGFTSTKDASDYIWLCSVRRSKRSKVAGKGSPTIKLSFGPHPCTKCNIPKAEQRHLERLRFSPPAPESDSAEFQPHRQTRTMTLDDSAEPAHLCSDYASRSLSRFLCFIYVHISQDALLPHLYIIPRKACLRINVWPCNKSLTEWKLSH